VLALKEVKNGQEEKEEGSSGEASFFTTAIKAR